MAYGFSFGKSDENYYILTVSETVGYVRTQQTVKLTKVQAESLLETIKKLVD